MKTLKKFFDKIRPLFEEGGKYHWLHSVYDGFETFLFVPNTTSKSGVHIHDSRDTKRTMSIVVVALIPALLFGMYNVGLQHYMAIGQEVGFWTRFFYGFLAVLPQIVVSYVVGLGIEFTAAQMKGEEIAEGFLVTGLLIPMILPVNTPLWMIALATAFAVIFAKEVFGGTGYNIFNVALVARAFLFFAYPSMMSGDRVFVRTGGSFGMGRPEMVKYGRRNIACLTIAPTGTTSLMSQTTSGIEPVFMPVYKRRRKVNPNDAGSQVDFVDENGDSWEEYVVFHHKFVTWMEANGYSTTKIYSNEEIDDLVSKSPYYKATSKDVDWLQKVRMQGRVQKWVDHSISVTINLPADITEDLVGELYMEAWKSGCKGCTVYREGSRSGVLVSNDDDTGKEGCFEMPQIVTTRPIELEADVIRFQNNKEKWIAFIGLLNGRPYEIFTGLNDEDDGILLPKRVTKGKIIKAYDNDGTKHYDFQFKNRRGYKVTIEGLDSKFNPEFWNYAKLISGVLRYGMPIDQVIKLVSGLELDSQTINTWKSGVVRALKRYLPSDSDVKGEECPVCGQETLVYQEGCLKCRNCGASKCG